MDDRRIGIGGGQGNSAGGQMMWWFWVGRPSQDGWS